MALRGEPGALIDACIHLATTDDLHMQFDIVIIMLNKNTLGVKKVQGQSEAALQIGMCDQKL